MMNKTTRGFTSILLVITLIAGLFTAIPFTANAVNYEWTEVAPGDIQSGDNVIITVTSSGNVTYGLNNTKGTSASPTATVLTVSDGKLSDNAETLDTCKWEVTKSGNSFAFGIGNDAYLYCNNSNNGVRVGSSSYNTFTIKDDYLYNSGRNRYLGVYNGQDWRCYSSITTNIQNQTLRFWKQTETSGGASGGDSGDTPSTYTVIWKNGDTTLETDENVASGATPSYNGAKPSKGSEGNYNYIFKGWKVEGGDNTVYNTAASDGVSAFKNVTGDITYIAYFEEIEIASGTDSLVRADTGIAANAGYSSWTDVTKTSGAVYAGNSAGGNSVIQLRASDNSGIVTTGSGGKAKKITVDWDSHTNNGNTLIVYGRNDAPYTSASDLYGSDRGSDLGTIVCGTGTELTINGDYRYIGLRSNSGGLYLSSINIEWVPTNSYTITWIVDGTTTTSYYAPGSTPDYGSTPTKQGYVFDHWEPSIVPATQNATYTAVFTEEETTPVVGTTDVIDLAFTEIDAGSYTGWSDKTGASGAVYAGINLKSSNNELQFNIKSNCGIITTTSGGKAKSIKITWGSGAQSGYIDIYGKNTAYSASSELYNTDTSGTQFAEVECGTTQEISLGSTYSYIGIRSRSGVKYVDKIEITWVDDSVQPTTAFSGYTVIWKDEDGTVLETDTGVGEGATPEFNGTAPTKAADDDYTYEFANWVNEATSQAGLKPVTSNVTYIASYTGTPKLKVTWKNGSSVLETDSYTAAQVAGNNITPEYNGEAPTKAADNDYTYEFDGWNIEGGDDTLYNTGTFPTVTENVTYIAHFNPTAITKYTVTWKDEDGTTLLEETYAENAAPSYNGTPVKPADSSHSYTFIGWKNEDTDEEYGVNDTLPDVTADVTYIARYEAGPLVKTDHIDLAFTGVTAGNTNYSTWNNKTGTSGAVYAGKTAGGNSVIQLASSNSDKGIVTTGSAGKVTKIAVEWNSNTTTSSDRIIDVYGKDTAYTSAANLYNAQNQGTLIGSIKYGESTELTITGNVDYPYIGLRSRNGAMFINSIDITWEPLNYYEVKWKDWDGTVLETDSDVPHGATPSYDGAPPQRDDDLTYSYTFSGWSSDGGETVYTDNFPSLTGDTVYIAQFTPTAITYHTVTWKNWDDTILYVEQYKHGYYDLEYNHPLPVRYADQYYTYSFFGWSPSVATFVDADATYTAEFSRTPIEGPVPVSASAGVLSVTDNKSYTQSDKYFYNYEGTRVSFNGSLSFSVNGTDIYFGSVKVAAISAENEKAFAGTVYVQGDGSYDHPYTFTPNYIYGSNSEKNISNGTRVYLEENANATGFTEVNPGDGFIGTSRIYVGDKEVTFSAAYSVRMATSNGFIGVGTEKYGYAYSGKQATAYNNVDPFDFDNGKYTLYYSGVGNSSEYLFTVDPLAAPASFEGDFKISWVNFDGSELYPDEYYSRGVTPEYKGSTPERAADSDFTYVFKGWSPKILPATRDITYIAKYDAYPDEEAPPISTLASVYKTNDGIVYSLVYDVTAANPDYLYYSYNGGEPQTLGAQGSFDEVDGYIYLGDKIVADINELHSGRDRSEFVHTVYVEGSGSYDNPFVFHPNYLYYSINATRIGDGQSISLAIEKFASTIRNSYPGDRYKGVSRVSVGNTLKITFLDNNLVLNPPEDHYLGVGPETYGYPYDGLVCPYEFPGANKTLYYRGMDENGYVFAETPCEYQKSFYTRVSAIEEDIFKKGRIEHFRGGNKLYTYNNYTEMFEELTESTVITELINQKLEPQNDDPLFSYNYYQQNDTDIADCYYGGRIIGVQRRLSGSGAEQDKENSLRFMTVLSSKVLKKLYSDSNYDYGYVFAAVPEGSNVNINKVTADIAGKHSCKNTENTLSGSYGDMNFNSTEYKYITASIDDVPDNVRLAVRFYITYKGETQYETEDYYITYDKGNLYNIENPSENVSGIVFDTKTIFN